MRRSPVGVDEAEQIGSAGGTELESMKHEHKWGPWLRLARWAQRFRFCINGWCPMGQKRNGWIFKARGERTPLR